MFVRYWVKAEGTFESINDALIDGKHSWLPTVASRSAGEVRSELGLPVGSRLIAADFKVDIGPPVKLTERTLVPIHLQAADHPGLFPQFDGQVELDRLTDRTCQVSVSGSYIPPGGQVGDFANRLALHKVAESAVQEFTQRIGRQLEVAVSRN